MSYEYGHMGGAEMVEYIPSAPPCSLSACISTDETCTSASSGKKTYEISRFFILLFHAWVVVAGSSFNQCSIQEGLKKVMNS
jgi:hypothetical protein